MRGLTQGSLAQVLSARDIVLILYRFRFIFQMASPPSPKLGMYYQSLHHSAIRCKSYTQPPMIGGDLICVHPPGTYFGPVEAIMITERFVTIYVEKQWINIWGADRGGVQFATPVPQHEVDRWIASGWTCSWN